MSAAKTRICGVLFRKRSAMGRPVLASLTAPQTIPAMASRPLMASGAGPLNFMASALGRARSWGQSRCFKVQLSRTLFLSKFLIHCCAQEPAADGKPHQKEKHDILVSQEGAQMSPGLC